MTTEYYELNQLFGAYMNQDSREEFVDAYAAAEGWLRESDRSAWQRALQEVTSLLAGTSGPLERRRSFGRSIEFLAADGDGFDAWLFALRSRLELALAASQDQLVTGSTPAAGEAG